MPVQIDHERALLTFGVIAVLVMAYSVLVVQQILLGLFTIGALGMVYLFFVSLQILDRIATALEILAEQERRE